VEVPPWIKRNARHFMSLIYKGDIVNMGTNNGKNTSSSIR